MVEAEIQVTEEMIAAADYVARFRGLGCAPPAMLAEVYRAMAALAPKDETVVHLAALLREVGCERLALKESNAALESENAELRRNCEGWANLARQSAAQQAAENAAWLEAEAEGDKLILELQARCRELFAQVSSLTTGFGPATDTPDPPRRPDGTLAPTKPLPVLKNYEPKRQIGG